MEIQEEDVRTKLRIAFDEVKQAKDWLKSWGYRDPIPSVHNTLWENNSDVVGDILACLNIEEEMLRHANVNSGRGLPSDQRKKLIEVQYLLFVLIDEAAREVKTTIGTDELTDDDDQNAMIVRRRARRSLYLHWRVVNLVTQSTLKEWYKSQISRLQRVLQEALPTKSDVFLAHVSADKEIVQRVIDGIRDRGKRALERVIGAINDFSGNPDQLDEVFKSEREKLDAVTLRMWFDRDDLMLGADLDAEISKAIASAKVFLVFITPNYDLGTYLRETEMPKIRKAFEERCGESELRAIPVVLSPNVWKERNPEWVVPWRTVTCPPQRQLFEIGEDTDRLVQLTVELLTADKELRSMTGEA